MNRKIFKIIIALLLVCAFLLILNRNDRKTLDTPTPSPTITTTTSDGVITLTHPENFGLAVTPEQILVTSYIPPCDEVFAYCLYYNGDAYKGTNFESAGVSIKKRTDLASERLCLNTPPQGFTNVLPDATSSADSYSSSVYKNVSDAGAGHYAIGAMYRLFVRDPQSCYEIMTRIGATQFANYPAGTIKEFSPEMSAQVKKDLDAIVEGISLKGSSNLFQKLN